MNELTTRVTIEPAQNGYMVYLNDYQTGISVRNVPYVFETMESLLEFIKTKLN
jgi:Zn-dependent M32 family carboxypeptidase